MQCHAGPSNGGRADRHGASVLVFGSFAKEMVMFEVILALFVLCMDVVLDSS